jgi:hypothetical protein
LENQKEKIDMAIDVLAGKPGGNVVMKAYSDMIHTHILERYPTSDMHTRRNLYRAAKEAIHLILIFPTPEAFEQTSKHYSSKIQYSLPTRSEGADEQVEDFAAELLTLYRRIVSYDNPEFGFFPVRFVPTDFHSVPRNYLEDFEVWRGPPNHSARIWLKNLRKWMADVGYEFINPAQPRSTS